MSRRAKNDQKKCNSIITFPITPQTLSSLKKEIKYSSDRASEYLDSLLATEFDNHKQQWNYIHQLLVACIYSISDISKCNKAITRCISLNLFKESYNFSIFHHNLLHGKLSTMPAKSPNLEQFQILMSIDRRCQENPGNISIYLVNLLRIFIGLKMNAKYSICEFLTIKNGLIFWMDRLKMADSQLHSALCDHIFRILYSVSFNEDCCNFSAQQLSFCIKFYKSSTKFQEGSYDKLLSQCHKSLKSSLNLNECAVLNFFVSQVFPTCQDYRPSMLCWLEPILFMDWKWKELDVIHKFLLKILNNEKVFVEILNFIKFFTPSEFTQESFPSTIKASNISMRHHSIFFTLLSCLNKKVAPVIEGIFQDALKGSTSSQSFHIMIYDSYLAILECLTGLENDDKYAINHDTIIVILSQIKFIQNQSDMIINNFWMHLKIGPSLASRLGILSFNVGASLYASKQYQRATCFFEESKRFNFINKCNDSKRDYKSWLGKIQCLYKLGDYAGCQTEVIACLQKFHNFLNSDLEKLDNLVAYYIHSSLKMDSYTPLCEILNLCWDVLIAKELAFLSAIEISFHRRESVLEYVVSREDTPLLMKCEYLLLQSDINPEKCESLCKQALEWLEPFKKSGNFDDVVEFLISKAFLSMVVVLKLQSSSWLEKIFYSWDLIMQNHSTVRASLWDKLLSCSIQLFDYLFNRMELKSAYSIHPYCEKFYSFSNETRDDEIAEVLIKVVELCVDLGHSGKAGLALSSAKLYMHKFSNDLKVRFHSCYIGYLLSIGNYEKASEVYLKLGDTDGDNNDLLCGRIELSKGNISVAGEKILAGYNSLLKEVKKCPSVSLYLLNQFFKALHWLCYVQIMQGLPLQLDYYFDQGLKMAKRHHSNLSGPILIEFVRFLTMKRDIPSSFKQIQFIKDEFDQLFNELTLFHASLLNCEGELHSVIDENLLAEKLYASAATVIDSELDPIARLEEDFRDTMQISRKKAAESRNLRSLGLEFFKGRINCLIGSISFKNGDIQSFEKYLNVAKSLPMTLFEKSLYYCELAKIRSAQFFHSYEKYDQGVFNESVGILFKSPLSKSKTIAPSSICQRADQLKSLLEESFLSVCRYGKPDDAQILANFLCKLYIFKKNVILERNGDIVEKIWSIIEFPKCLFQFRQSLDQNLPSFKNIEKTEEFASDILDQMKSSNMILCCINVDISTDTLLISRIDPTFRAIIKLPVRRFAIREGCVNGDGYSFKKAMDIFADIMRKNKETTSSAKNCETTLQKKEWLKMREDLDRRLKNFLEKLESEWLAGFKGILSDLDFSNCQSHVVNFQSRLDKLIMRSVARCFKTKSKLDYLVDINICELFLRGLGPKPTYEDLEDVLYYILDGYQLQGIAIEYDEICIEDIRDELKDLVELFFRETSNVLENCSNRHTILILDKSIQHLPWESLPILRSRPVSRVPNIQILKNCFNNRKGPISHLKPFYILNPSGDLLKTEAKMRQYLSGFEGITGRAPTKEEFYSGLEEHDLFMYFGHGGGEVYMNSNDIPKLKKVPAILLFGCSSGYLKDFGEFESLGIALEYLRAGCPIIVGNLWDVTDVDLDRFSISLMKKVGIGKKDQIVCSDSFFTAANCSRISCKLSYIVGAAPICYGIPAGFT